MKNILIIQTASIGDAVLATPVVEKLHHFFPNTDIDLLLKKGHETLFISHPFVRRVISWQKGRGKYRRLIKILMQIRREKYDAVINLHRFASSGFLTAFSGAHYKSGFTKNPFSLLFSERFPHSIGKSESLHEVHRNLSLVLSLTDPDMNWKPAIYPSQKDFESTSEFRKGKYIVLAPASLWFTKQFPADQWSRFLDACDPSVPVLLVGSMNDQPIAEEIISGTTNKNLINLCGRLSLLETAALMKDATMVFSNDSAPQHLASAVNAPVTSIFCSTIRSFGFGPLSDNSAVIETNENLECRPCGIHGHQSCPEKHFRCATTISTDQLIARC